MESLVLCEKYLLRNGSKHFFKSLDRKPHMDYPTLVNTFIEGAAAKFPKVLTRLVEDITSGKEQQELEISAMVCKGQVVVPKQPFQLFINGTLERYDRSVKILIYRITADYTEYTFPEDDIPCPKVILLIFRDVSMEDLISSAPIDKLYQVTPVRHASQLFQILSQCATVGKVHID